MIDVKGTKTGAAGPQGASRYRATDEGTSQAPLIVGGFLAAVVAFVRSLSSKAEAAPLQEPDTAPTTDPPQAPADATFAPTEEAAETAAVPPQQDDDAAPSPAANIVTISNSNVVSLFAQSYARTSATADQVQLPDRTGTSDIGQISGATFYEMPPDDGPAAGRLLRLMTTPTDAGSNDDDTRTGGGKRGPNPLPDVLTTGVFFIALSDLLPAAATAGGRELSIEDIKPSSGWLEPTAGGYLYHPDPVKPQQVVLTFTVSDGTETVVANLAFDVLANPVTGTDGADALDGTYAADVINGQAARDEIDALGGDDLIYGGAGADVIRAGAGDDVVFGGAGDDLIFGMDGDDLLHGDAGDDVLHGGAGDDQLDGGIGNDVLDGGTGSDLASGGAGDDLIYGMDGDDKMQGDAGDDVLQGGAGADWLDGGVGNDVLDGGAGADRVSGGAGDDHIIASLDHADDLIAGGDGQDTLDVSAAKQAVTVDLGQQIATGAEIGTDRIGGIEDVIGGDGDDRLIGDQAANALQGGKGDDLILGNAGNDVIDGGAGQDRLSGGLGNDIISGGAGDDTVDGGAGQDVMYGGAGRDILIDGAGADTISGDQGDDLILVFGDGEDDIFMGGDGFDTLDLSQMTESVSIDFDAKTASSVQVGSDSIDGFEVVIGGKGNDDFHINVSADGDSLMLTGGDGDDTYALSFNDAPDGVTITAFQITDFSAGDVIRAGQSAYRSNSGHGNSNDPDYATPITDTLRMADVRYEMREIGEFTILQVGSDTCDDIFEVYLNGNLEIWIDFS